MLSILIPIVVFIFLLFCSYRDLMYHRLENGYSISLLTGGVVYALVRGEALATGLGLALMTLVSYALWHYETIGGADAKLMIALVPFLPFVGTPNSFMILVLFIVIFGVSAVLYGLAAKMILKRTTTYIPLIPIITLTFALLWISFYLQN